LAHPFRSFERWPLSINLFDSGSYSLPIFEGNRKPPNPTAMNAQKHPDFGARDRLSRVEKCRLNRYNQRLVLALKKSPNAPLLRVRLNKRI
jgi:hypothetical protein